MDEEPDFIAALDQFKRATADIVEVVRAYYVRCLEAGFTSEQALTLAVAFQHSWMQSG